MTTKTKAKPKAKKATTRKAPRKRTARKPKHAEHLVAVHPFGPKDRVQIHPSWAVEVERSQNREPIPKPLQVVTLPGNAELKVKLPNGSYTAAAQRGSRWLFTTFTVK
jgi:hypothetical protein